jgi:hypothetical protein
MRVAVTGAAGFGSDMTGLRKSVFTEAGRRSQCV